MGTTTINAGSIRNSDIASAAGIEASKLFHRHKMHSNFGLAYGDTVTDEHRIVFVATASGTINSFKCKVQGAESGANNVAFDLKVNNSTVLSGVVTINSAAGTNIQTGTISSPSLSANDVVSIDMNTTSSDATGPIAWVEIDEAAS